MRGGRKGEEREEGEQGEGEVKGSEDALVMSFTTNMYNKDHLTYEVRKYCFQQV